VACLVADSRFLTVQLVSESVVTRHNSICHLTLRIGVSDDRGWTSRIHLTVRLVLVNVWLCLHDILIGMHFLWLFGNNLLLKINYTILSFSDLNN
jgi:hypothetical protein